MATKNGTGTDGKQEQYVALQLELNQVLAEELKARRMEVADVMGLLEVLAVAKNYDELKMMVEALAKSKYPGLQRAFDSERAAAQRISEEKIEDIVKALTKVDPGKAAALAKMAADRSVTTDELVAEFPEISELL